jgi:murein tripeptide amidase MpaA
MHTRLLAACLAAALAPLGTAQVPAYQPHSLVQVHVRDAHTLAALLALDLDLAGCAAIELPRQTIDVIADARALDKLRASGLDFEITIADLEAHYAREASKHGLQGPQTLTPPLGQGAMGGHYTLAQVVAILDSFAQDFPSICARKVSIGRSIEGRDLWMVKISDNVNVDEPEPEVYFDALHHAREPLSMEATLVFMDRLLSGWQRGEPEARFLVEQRELYFVPVVNPDGYEYNRSTNPNGGGMWRKNRRLNTGGSYGVDLNRNYTTGWTAPYGGNSTSPTSETYRGTAPFSEPEALALDNFAATRQFTHAFSTHTYTDVLLRPWGYQTTDPPNFAEYDRVGAQAVQRNGVQHGKASTLLYIAAGTALDHHHAAHGSLGWTAELGRSNEGGFWPSGQAILNIAERHQHMFRTIALTGGAWPRIQSVTITEAPGGNNNGRVDPGETGRVVVAVTNEGLTAFQQDVLGALTSSSSGVTIGNGAANFGKVARFGAADNAAAPMTFAVPAGYQQPIVQLNLRLTADGHVEDRALPIVYGAWRLAVDDDCEQDRGFRRGTSDTATAGHWARGVPQQTTSGSATVQPGADHSPNGTQCWVTDPRAGSTADDYDVDGGLTDLVSPRLDLAHLHGARLSLWYWYFESYASDWLVIDVSADDGGQWTELLRRELSSGGWLELVRDLPPPLTDRMRLRVRAQDHNASLVEALVDDLAILGLQQDGAVTLLSSGALGSAARFGLCGQSGATVVLCASAGTANIPLPGITGSLLLDPATLLALPAIGLGASGYQGLDLGIPNDASLSGKTLYFQALHAVGSALRLDNRQALRLQ